MTGISNSAFNLIVTICGAVFVFGVLWWIFNQVLREREIRKNQQEHKRLMEEIRRQPRNPQ